MQATATDRQIHNFQHPPLGRVSGIDEKFALKISPPTILAPACRFSRYLWEIPYPNRQKFADQPTPNWFCRIFRSTRSTWIPKNPKLRWNSSICGQNYLLLNFSPKLSACSINLITFTLATFHNDTVILKYFPKFCQCRR